MDILTDFWQQLAPFLQPLWDSILLWRSVGLFLLGVVIVGFLFRRPLARWLSDERSQEHDAALFRKSEEFVSDRFLESFLNQYLSQQVCLRKDIARIPRFYEEFDRQGNQFLDRKVGRTFGDLLRTLMKVNGFVTQHFFLNTDEDRLELHPKLIDKKRYDAYVKELKGLINLTWGAYRGYRDTVKQELKV